MHKTSGGPRHKRHAGFTLIEVMIAVLIISVAAIGIVQLQTVSIGLTGDSRDNLVAAQLSFEIADTIRSLETANNGNAWTNDYPNLFFGATAADCDPATAPQAEPGKLCRLYVGAGK